ncbi:MAG: hypothetical protein E5X61_41690, partial [Mesorhizobium sp.]
MRPANGRFLRFRYSRTKCPLRSGSRNPPFSTRPDLNFDKPLTTADFSRLALPCSLQEIASAIAAFCLKVF